MSLKDRHDAKWAAAIEIAEAAKAIDHCEWHEHITVRGSAEQGAAYALGNAWLKSGRLSGVFHSPEEMKDHVHRVMIEATDDCEACALQEES